MIWQRFSSEEPDLRPDRRCLTGVEEGIAIAGLVAAAAGTAVTYYGQQQAAENATKAGKYNAALAENQATQAGYATQTVARQQRERGMRVLGMQRSIAAGAGVTPDTGSPLLISMDTAAQSELDAQTALYTGKVQSDSALAQAAYARWQGKSAARGYEIGSGMTLLQGAGNIAGQAASEYSNYTRKKPKGLGYGTAQAQGADPGNVYGMPY